MQKTGITTKSPVGVGRIIKIRWTSLYKQLSCGLVGVALLLVSNITYAVELDNQQIAELSVQMFAAQGDAKTDVIQQLAKLNDKSLIPTLSLIHI